MAIIQKNDNDIENSLTSIFSNVPDNLKCAENCTGGGAKLLLLHARSRISQGKVNKSI
jgi:nicotinamide mononucleotide (NMN) deamidase PncC